MVRVDTTLLLRTVLLALFGLWADDDDAIAVTVRRANERVFLRLRLSGLAF